MSNVILTLGGVPFQDFEVPEQIRFGGGQRLAVHDLIGGGRVVDALGDDAGEVSFAGIFSGSDAAARAQALDAARATGAAVPLVWDGFFYTVVIAEFAAEYAKPWWIPFALRCAVVLDSAAVLATVVAPVASLISSDISAAGGLVSLATLPAGVLGDTSAAGLAAAQAQIATGISNTGGALSGNARALNTASDPTSGVAALNAASANSAQLAGLTRLSGYVSRAAVNLENELS
jgi:uncharacterized protein YciI